MSAMETLLTISLVQEQNQGFPISSKYDRILAYAENKGGKIVNDQITSTPGVLQGKPCIAGTRISVELILEQLALGDTIDDLLDDYPHITREQILAALAFAHDQLHEKYLQEHMAS